MCRPPATTPTRASRRSSSSPSAPTRRAYFAKRYGKLVRPIVTGTETTVLECAPATAFKIEPDGLVDQAALRERRRRRVRAHRGDRVPGSRRDRRRRTRPDRPPHARLADRLRTLDDAQRPARRSPRDRHADRQAAPAARPAPGDPPCPPRPQAAAARAADAQQSDVERLAERISADARAGDGFLDGYGRAGFAVAGMRVTRQTVVVQLYTTRQDHAAWFTARYGPAVRTEVIGDRYECVGDFE